MDHDRNTCQTDFDETSEDSHENDTIEPDEIKLRKLYNTLFLLCLYNS